jgi:SWIM zinc finger
MVTLAGTTEIVEPLMRHGKCRLHITIGGTCYALRPIPGQPLGVKVFSLRSLNGEREGKNYCVAIVNREAGCTCPDAEVNGAVCKHVMALRATGFLPVSARTASESKAEAARLAVAHRRRAAAPPAAVVAPPTERPDRLARARRRHSPVSVMPPASPTPPASPASPFATGFRKAVSAHVAQLQGGVA